MNPTAISMLSVCLLTATAIAQSTNTDWPVTFDFGGDLRIRQEAFDHIPILADPPGVTRGGENNAFRIRPRIWG